jgi:hypothetical protein
MSIKDLLHQATSLVYDADEKPATPATKIPTSNVPHPAFNVPLPTVPSGAFGAAPATSPFAIPTTVVVDEKLYQSILGKTNFNTTTVGKAVIRYYDALEGVIADQSQRFKAAIGQAQKLDGVSPDQVLATFDQMQAALDADAANFAKLATSEEANQITARQQKITSLQQQQDNISQQIAQLQTELASAQGTHGNAVAQYGAAHDKRSQEIQVQKAQVAGLLR